MTEMKRGSEEVRSFQGFLTFPKPIFCQPDGLGAAYESAIGGFACEVLLPHFPSGEAKPGAALLSPPPVDEHRAQLLSQRRWGSVTHDTGQAAVEAALVRFDMGVPAANLERPVTDAGVDLMVPPAASFHRDFRQGLSWWFDEFTAWLTAWSGQVMDPDLAPRSPHAEVWELGSRGPSTQGSGTVLGGVAFNRSDTAADYYVIERAFFRAGQGRSFPLAHRLLRNAHKSDGRLALIDAATAAEVAVSETLKTLFTGTDPEGKEDAIGTASGLVDLIKIHNGLAKVPLQISWKRAANQLANPRNRAVHAGEAPDARTLEQALDVAKAIVEECSPLPGPDG